MTVDEPWVPGGHVAMTEEQRRRWDEVLDRIADALPAGAVSAVVDGTDRYTRVVADRLADTLRAAGRPCVRLTDDSPVADEDTWYADRTAQTVVLGDGARWRQRPPTGTWDVVVWLRADRAPTDDRAHDVDIVVDLHDRNWPVIRHLSPRLGRDGRWHVNESRAFFAVRAATWDSKFGDDAPAYAAGITEAYLPFGGVVADIGCGTGRALAALREAVGPQGMVIGVDLTPQMLSYAQPRAAACRALLVLADGIQLPFADASLDAVFAAGLIPHLPDAKGGLRELARVTRPGGRLALFHPSGRAALAARHGRSLRRDESLAEAPLRRSTTEAGWQLTRYDDPPHRFLAVAIRW